MLLPRIPALLPLLRPSTRRNPFLIQTASWRLSQRAALLRSFATSPAHTPVNPTPSPNPFQPKPAHETDTQSAHPTSTQAHGSSAEAGGTQGEASTARQGYTESGERMVDAEPFEANWVDYRPNLVEVEVIRNAEGDMVGLWEGEEVIFPDLDTSLEWVLSTPVDTHLFEEAPIIKECPEDTEQAH